MNTLITTLLPKAEDLVKAFHSRRKNLLNIYLNFVVWLLVKKSKRKLQFLF